MASVVTLGHLLATGIIHSLTFGNAIRYPWLLQLTFNCYSLSQFACPKPNSYFWTPGKEKGLNIFRVKVNVMWRFRQDKLIINSHYSELLRPEKSRSSNHGDEQDFP